MALPQHRERYELRREAAGEDMQDLGILIALIRALGESVEEDEHWLEGMKQRYHTHVRYFEPLVGGSRLGFYPNPETLP